MTHAFLLEQILRPLKIKNCRSPAALLANVWLKLPDFQFWIEFKNLVNCRLNDIRQILNILTLRTHTHTHTHTQPHTHTYMHTHWFHVSYVMTSNSQFAYNQKKKKKHYVSIMKQRLTKVRCKDRLVWAGENKTLPNTYLHTLLQTHTHTLKETHTFACSEEHMQTKEHSLSSWLHLKSMKSHSVCRLFSHPDISEWSPSLSCTDSYCGDTDQRDTQNYSNRNNYTMLKLTSFESAALYLNYSLEHLQETKILWKLFWFLWTSVNHLLRLCDFHVHDDNCQDSSTKGLLHSG